MKRTALCFVLAVILATPGAGAEFDRAREGVLSLVQQQVEMGRSMMAGAAAMNQMSLKMHEAANEMARTMRETSLVMGQTAEEMGKIALETIDSAERQMMNLMAKTRADATDSDHQPIVYAATAAAAAAAAWQRQKEEQRQQELAAKEAQRRRQKLAAERAKAPEPGSDQEPCIDKGHLCPAGDFMGPDGEFKECGRGTDLGEGKVQTCYCWGPNRCGPGKPHKLRDIS
ncbi:unnamed protein product [Vitrella brassicaformis CCMP3155]|uniref:Uncharacterized protein n=1 Tax=Vitrella brassicaformis (strain CCMP3155) TaxID=1169540 RepID=A0A0G4EUW7_VITBC|nr:unnamed protein product [Vitrella brassicaformis CCMP3155]|eukprot:CEM01826.1 unnamed protein product [Vitrella brassicaformis CCMP3155]